MKLSEIPTATKCKTGQDCLDALCYLRAFLSSATPAEAKRANAMFLAIENELITRFVVSSKVKVEINQNCVISSGYIPIYYNTIINYLLLLTTYYNY